MAIARKPPSRGRQINAIIYGYIGGRWRRISMLESGIAVSVSITDLAI